MSVDLVWATVALVTVVVVAAAVVVFVTAVSSRGLHAHGGIVQHKSSYSNCVATAAAPISHAAIISTFAEEFFTPRKTQSCPASCMTLFTSAIHFYCCASFICVC